MAREKKPRGEGERAEDQPSALGTGGREDPTQDETPAAPAGMSEEAAHRATEETPPGPTGVNPLKGDEKGANKGPTPRGPASIAGHEDRDTYREKTGRGEELTRESAGGDREYRRESRSRVSPASPRDPTADASDKHTNQ